MEFFQSACPHFVRCHTAAEPVLAKYPNVNGPLGNSVHRNRKHFGNEVRNRWLLRSHGPRTWLTQLSLLTDDSLTRLVHWPRNPPERLSAELHHQHYPLTPVLVEKVSVVLGMQVIAVLACTLVKLDDNTGGFWKTFRSLNLRC